MISKITWQTSLETLKQGNHRFYKQKLASLFHDQQSLDAFEKGQNPYATVLCCSDSRVSPDIIFDQKLGNIFIIQNAGNVCDTSVLGSIQYSVTELSVPLILILGHTHCGAISAAHQSIQVKGPLNHIISTIQKNLHHHDLEAATFDHVKQTAEDIFNILQTHADQFPQQVAVIPAVYDITTGHVTWLEALHKETN